MNEYINKIINKDCLEALPLLCSDSVNLVVTSPPYNVDLGNNKFKKDSYDIYDDNKSYDDFIFWLENVFKEIYRILKDDGRVCINIGDVSNGKILTHCDINTFMKKIGYLNFSHIIWNKNQVSNRTAWGSYSDPSCPSFPCPFEHILIFCKKNRKLQHKGECDISKTNFKKWAYGIWTMTPETKLMRKYNHPAMFPEELPRRCIQMLSYKKDVVLDPFVGVGTTAIVAKSLGRKYIGIDLSPDYCEIAQERLKECEGMFYDMV